MFFLNPALSLFFVFCFLCHDLSKSKVYIRVLVFSFSFHSQSFARFSPVSYSESLFFSFTPSHLPPKRKLSFPLLTVLLTPIVRVLFPHQSPALNASWVSHNLVLTLPGISQTLQVKGSALSHKSAPESVASPRSSSPVLLTN